MQGPSSGKNAGASGLGVLFTGYMEKQNPIRKSYSKRFLVLTHEAFYWFRRPDNTDLFGEERGSISLSAILSVRRKDEYSFDIEDTAHVHRFFRYIAGTGSVAQCDEWITQIRSACKKLKEKIEQTAREKRKKKGSGSLLPAAAAELDTEINGDHQKRSVAVRMVTLKNNGIELVMARNPLWERLICIPLMQDGDVVLISTSNGGIVTLSRSFMLEKAMKSQDLIRDLMLTGEDLSSVHHTTPQAALGGRGSIGFDHVSNDTIIAGNPNRSQNSSAALGPGNHSHTLHKRPSAGQGEETKMEIKDGRGVTSTASSTGVSTSELIVPTTSANAGYFVDVPILNTELPSSLKLSVLWINDEVDGALKDGTYDNTAETRSKPYTMYAFCFDIFRQALKNSGDNITLMLALMCTIVGVTSLRAVNSNNSLLFMFCMCLAVSVLYTAAQKARRQVEQDRDPRQKQAELISGEKGDGSSINSIAGVQSFHLVIAGHSYTSPDQPIVQTIESIPERFIRACEGDVEQARRRYETTRHWRETEGVNTILVEHQPHFHHIKNFYPHYNAGRGRQGHAVYYERPGELMPQLKQLHSRGIGTKEMLRHWLYITEYQFEVLCKGEPLAKGISVIDVKGVGVFDFMGKTLEFVKKSVQVAGQHYPERSFVIYVVNANSIFTTIWSIIKGWIHENTVKKVRILGPSETLSGLQEHIDISQIPEYYGGELKYGDDVDGCRYHAPESEELYELVRKVNSGEVTSMDQIYALYDLPNPNGTSVPAPEAAVAAVVTADPALATANPATSALQAQGRRPAKQRPSLKFSHSPAIKGDGITPPRRSVEQADEVLHGHSLLDQEDSDEDSEHAVTPARHDRKRHDLAGISPLTMTPASRSGLRSRRGRETNESSSGSPDCSPTSLYGGRAATGGGGAGGFKDSPESRASHGTTNSAPARGAFSDYYEY